MWAKKSVASALASAWHDAFHLSRLRRKWWRIQVVTSLKVCSRLLYSVRTVKDVDTRFSRYGPSYCVRRLLSKRPSCLRVCRHLVLYVPVEYRTRINKRKDSLSDIREVWCHTRCSNWQRQLLLKTASTTTTPSLMLDAVFRACHSYLNQFVFACGEYSK